VQAGYASASAQVFKFGLANAPAGFHLPCLTRRDTCPKCKQEKLQADCHGRNKQVTVVLLDKIQDGVLVRAEAVAGQQGMLHGSCMCRIVTRPKVGFSS
jgi:hypothetical protein